MDCKSLRSHIVDSSFYSSGYSTEEARLIFCDLRRMQRWLDVEAAPAISQESLGIIPLSAADELIQTAHPGTDLNLSSYKILDKKEDGRKKA